MLEKGMSGGGDLLVCPSELRKEAWAGSREEPRGRQASFLPSVQGAPEREQLVLERASGSSSLGESRVPVRTERWRNLAAAEGVRNGLTECLEVKVWKEKEGLGVPASPQGLE